MKSMTYDAATRRFSGVEEEAKATEGTKGIAVRATLVDKLLAYAKEDGFDLEGKTKQAASIRQNRAVRMYAEQAITEFIQARES